MRAVPTIAALRASALAAFGVLVLIPFAYSPAFAADADDGVWRPPAQDADVWKPDGDAEGDDGVWKPDGDAEDDDDVWKPDDDDSWRSDDDGAVVPPGPIEQFYGTHFLTLEYRVTDVFDDLRDPTNDFLVGPPPERLVYVAYGLALDRVNYLKFEGESQSFAEDSVAAKEHAPGDGGWALLSWDRTLATGARMYLDMGTYWVEDASGFNMSGEYGWSMGHNLDVSGRLQMSASSSSTGFRVGAKANAYFTSTTALQYKGWYGWDDGGYRGSRNQLKFAQAAGARGAVHLMYRTNVASADEARDKRSQVYETEYRRQLGRTNTLLSVACRWYRDNADTSADGIAFGVVQPYRRGSFGAGYRRYTSSVDVDAGSFWIVLNFSL